MQADPDAGIIQTLPLIINRNTLFARLQQFAARIYGPIIADGLSVWMGRDGNYWGHNAIIRTAAFAAHCGMPDLSGKPPFGGHILSHDFVEAALMRRAGYAVYMLTEVTGSYEESPPSLIDLSARDRRWCQGNLQHMRVIGAAGLHPATRQHFATGVFSYLASPLWLFQLLVGLTLALQAHYIRPEYFTDAVLPVSGLAAVRCGARPGAIRRHAPDPARAEDFRHARRSGQRSRPPRLRWRDSPGRLDLRGDHPVGSARAGHDADPIRLGVRDPARP